eukprot:776174-Pyramimonas_sp.AAC.1
MMLGGGLYANNQQEHGRNLPTDRALQPCALISVRRDSKMRLVTILRSQRISPTMTRRFLNPLI